MIQKSVVVLGAFFLVGLGLYMFLGQSASTKASNIAEILRENGYTEFKPPSRSAVPGSLVLVHDGTPLTLGIICGNESSLGLPLESIPSSSSFSTDLSAALNRSYALDAELLSKLKSNVTLSDIEDVVLKLTNVRLLEVSDDTVVANLPNRTEACRDAIRSRHGAGQKITMIKAALMADVSYEVTARGAGGAEADANVSDSLAANLGSKVQAKTSNKITLKGENLIWGIRDDQVLALIGTGLAATGSSAQERRLIPESSVIESVEVADQARLEFPEELRRASYDVKPLIQVGRNDCWATVFTMLSSWRDDRSYTVREVVENLGGEYLEYWRTDSGLPGGKEQDFVRVAGMTAQPPANYFLSGFVKMLSSSGPLWINTGDGLRSHAKLLVGIYGPYKMESPEAYQETIFEFIDPKDGFFKYQSAFDFMTDFENEVRFIVETGQDDVNLRWQILHL